ncbi:hypothetical protein MTO96_030686, partial [Rhipicephalus appendiculatus]
ESWVLSLRNKFKNMRKKVESCPPEMMEKREKSQQKRPRQHEASIPNKKLCRLFDSSHLIIYGETAESVERHNHWLQVNAASADESDLRPRLLATAQARHEHLRSLTISEALLLFPFLASEASLLLEFDILFKKNIAEVFAKGCQQLCDAVLEHATDVEMIAFTHAARGLGVKFYMASLGHVGTWAQDQAADASGMTRAPLKISLLVCGLPSSALPSPV